MLKSNVFPYYKQYVKDFRTCYDIIQQQQVTGTVSDLCKLRGYAEGYEQYKLLEELNIKSYQISDTTILGDRRKELGLVSKNDGFLLDNRYILEVNSPSGDLISLIGYYPDYSKYVTAPTRCFSKELLFFNIDNALELSWTYFNGLVFLVEGIFDCLSLRSIGLPAIATMGNNVNSAKHEILKLFRKVVYIPDNDKTGRNALNKNDTKHGWKVPFNATGLKLKGDYVLDGKTYQVKDIDKAIAIYDAESLREILLESASSRDEVVDLQL